MAKNSPNPPRSSNRLGCTLVGGIVIALAALLILSLNVRLRPLDKAELCQENLRQIMLALQAYESQYGSFPPVYLADDAGRPAHSWRVLLLPFLGQEDLYRQYDFAEPWNGPNNSRLAERMPRVYKCPADADKPFEASYLAVVGEGTAWPGPRGMTKDEIKDGLTSTLMLAEAAESGIPWMEPRDMTLKQALAGVNRRLELGIAGIHPDGVAYIATCDGRVMGVTNKLSSYALEALLTAAGGEKLHQTPTGKWERDFD